jgi:hypothetical protein
MSSIFGNSYSTIYLKTGAVVNNTYILPRYGEVSSWVTNNVETIDSYILREWFVKVDKLGKKVKHSSGLNGRLPFLIEHYGFKYNADIQITFGQGERETEAILETIWDWEDAKDDKYIWIKPHNDKSYEYKVTIMNSYSPEFIENYKLFKVLIKLESDIYATRLGA